jgi:hypothetical protein
LAIAVICLVAGGCQAEVKSTNEAKANEVIARTRTTRATFAVYNWHRIWRQDLPPTEEWTAEFHSGAFDRVETPRDRVVANCDSKTGSALALNTGQTTTGPRVADALCGIDANAQVLDTKWLGTVDTPCGRADRVQVTDSDFVRTYDVSPEGMIIQTTYVHNTPQRSPALIDLAATCTVTLPSPQMFDDASLQTSFVPDQRKRAPS